MTYGKLILEFSMTRNEPEKSKRIRPEKWGPQRNEFSQTTTERKLDYIIVFLSSSRSILIYYTSPTEVTCRSYCAWKRTQQDKKRDPLSHVAAPRERPEGELSARGADSCR